MLKSYWWGGWGGVVAHAIIVSAQGPNPSFFFFWGTFIQLGSLLGQGLGPGLDKRKKIFTKEKKSSTILPVPIFVKTRKNALH